MDILELLNSIKKGYGIVIRREWSSKGFQSVQTNESLYLVYMAIFLVVLCVVVIFARRRHLKAASSGGQFTSESGVRFRKRDKALFYGRKMLRKVRSISDNVPGQGKKRKIVMRLARKLLRLKKDNIPIELKVLEPPAEYMEEDLLNESSMPLDVLYMLQSIRVFGHFEKPVFLKLCKHCEILKVPINSFLFKIGDTDENVYIVQSGKVNVFITCQDGSSLALKIVKPGESVTSLLSFTDVLIGRPTTYKTVCAKAVEESTVVKLPMAAFHEIFEEYPDIFIRVIQVIMVRLQRVTFTALHQYLGLSAELMQTNPIFKTARRKSVILPSPSKTGKVPLGTSGPASHEEDVGSLTDKDEHSYQLYDLSHINVHSFVAQSNAYSKRGEQRSSDLQRNLSKSGLLPMPAQQPQVMSENVNCDTQQVAFESRVSAPITIRRRQSPMVHNELIDDEIALNVASDAFIKLLGLENVSLIKDKIELREFQSGTYLMKEESSKDVALIYVVSGTLLVSQKMADAQEEVHIFTAYPGEVVGGLAVLTGEPSFFTIRAKHLSTIAQISKPTFYNIVKDKPRVLLNVAHSVIQRVSPFVRQVDFALDWVFLESGRALYRQDDDSDSTFIVLSGRLRSVIRHSNEKKEVVGEYGKGDLVGIVEMVTHTTRSTTVMAVRDSELAKLPEGLFDAIKLRFPIVVTRLINLLGHRILGSWQKPSLTRMNLRRGEPTNTAVESRPTQINFSTVAIVGISDDVPLTAFTYELHHCLSSIGTTKRLTSEVIRKTLGPSIFDHSNEYRLTSWLAQQEDQHKIALYQCDMVFSQWTQRCIRQADCILIVGLGENTPTIGKVEKEVERLAIRTQKELVLLHREGGKRPINTITWLNMRSWVSTHHHIQCSKRMFIRRSQYRINELYSKILSSEPNIHSDFSRLARWLTGTSVGLVLGGGGARGAAHIGMIKAIQEAGIPIDMVGGVSIGAFMGALWCSEKNITTVTQKARAWSEKMTHWWRQLFDLTYPVTSMFSGRDFNQTIKGTFGDTYIEDLWLPYFTVTTDITASCMRLHCHGSLWRYVRASMSLSGYMPPLCDPADGHLLLDGGYVNNLPADVMRSLGAHHIFAIDVGSVDDTDLTNYGDDLSGWWLLWKKYNPFTTQVKVPNLPDIQSRLAYVSCVRQLEEVKNSDYCEYIRPPIDKYKTLQFGSFDEIRNVGYECGKKYFENRRISSGVLPILKNLNQAQNIPQQHLFNISAYNFTDLTQLVCKVPRQYEYDGSSSSSSNEDDYFEEGQEVGYASEPSVGILDNSQTVLHRRRAGSLSLSENELESEGEFSVKKNM